MAVGTYGKHRPDKIEFENLDLHRRGRQHVRNEPDFLLEQCHCRRVVGCAGQLGLQFDAPVGIDREVLDGVREDLVVADQGKHVVGRVDRRGKQAHLLDGARNAGHRDKIANLHRPQDDQEHPAGKVGQQPGPGHADGHTGGGKECGEGGGLDSEIAQDADHQQDVQGDIDYRAQVAHQRGIDLLTLQRALYDTADLMNQPATNDPEGNCREYLDAQFRAILQRHVLPARHVLCIHVFLQWV